MTVKVSVVIPVYKVEKYIQKCLESVINQTLREIEIIAIDDGSPDNCGVILNNYADKDERIKVIHKDNEGVSKARNNGIDCSNGKYLYIMDSDDYLEIDALEKMYVCAEKDDADVVIADHYFFYGDNEEIQEKKHFFSKEFCINDKQTIVEIINMVLYPMYSPFPTKENTGLGLAAPWTKLVKRELIYNNHLYFDHETKGIFDDGLFALNVFSCANSVSYIRENIYHYRQIPTSLMRGYNTKRIEINEIIFSKINSISSLISVNEEFYEAFCARKLLFLKYAFEAFVFHKNNNCNNIERFKTYISVLNMPSYVSAASDANVRKLRPKEKKTRLIVRNHFIALLYYVKRII